MYVNLFTSPQNSTTMKRLINWLFPAYSKWEDVKVIEQGNTLHLLQIRHRIKDNKKQFRKACIGSNFLLSSINLLKQQFNDNEQ